MITVICSHYDDVIMTAMASQITSLMIVYSAVYSGRDERKYQSSASLAFVRGIHRWLVNSPHKGLVTWKMFAFDDVVMPCALRSKGYCRYISLSVCPIDPAVRVKIMMLQLLYQTYQLSLQDSSYMAFSEMQMHMSYIGLHLHVR